MLKNQPSKEEILDAIKEGIKEAFLEMTESTDVIRTEQVMHAITSGVLHSFPSLRDILDAIENATYKAMENRSC